MSALEKILTCVNARIPLVVGTTGQWYEQLDLVKKEVEANKTALLYATNFSIGVNIFFAINNYLAEIMKSYNNYNPEIEEIHHTQKKDSPSGTAITIANGILSRLTNKTKWENIVLKDNEKHHFSNDTLQIKSVRKDPAPGTHIVKYISPTDTIQICHEAFNRNGFALGSVLASEWLHGKKGIFTMEDIIKF
ncbi:MAG: 4-hydroxy-tetrahydrodipicolinate reductase [Solitalea-like symbiont of Acarus siro]